MFYKERYWLLSFLKCKEPKEKKAYGATTKHYEAFKSFKYCAGLTKSQGAKLERKPLEERKWKFLNN